MEANKNRESSAASTETVESNSRKPIKVFRIEDVSLSIFANPRRTTSGERTFYNCSFTRSYQTSKGEWKRTQSYDLNNLGAVTDLAKQASEFIRGLLDKNGSVTNG
jgi:hypothetical protein